MIVLKFVMSYGKVVECLALYFFVLCQLLWSNCCKQFLTNSLNDWPCLSFLSVSISVFHSVSVSVSVSVVRAASLLFFLSYSHTIHKKISLKTTATMPALLSRCAVCVESHTWSSAIPLCMSSRALRCIRHHAYVNFLWWTCTDQTASWVCSFPVHTFFPVTHHLPYRR